MARLGCRQFAQRSAGKRLDEDALTALQRKGIDSRFLYFPEENHWVLKPQNSVQWHDEVLGWLNMHTKP